MGTIVVEPSVLYRVPNTEIGLALSSRPKIDGKTVYRKQLIYCDDFEKGDLHFTVTPPLLNHWHNSVEQFKQNGIDIPMPLSHIEDEEALNNPLNRRGTLHETEIAKDAKGRDSLYGFLTFNDAESEKLAASTDVSLFSPGEFKDGKGRKYFRPIRHVCFTDFPVIPGLEKFEAIAASLSDSQPPIKEPEMAFNAKSIAKKLGVNPDLNDTALEAAIETAIEELLKKAEKKEEPKEEPIAAAFLNMTKQSRSDKLKKLVEGGHITPAVETELQTVFADDKTLALSLSLSDDKKNVVERDNFTKICDALAKNEPVKLGEQSGSQTLSLAHPSKASNDDKVVADAKRRAQEAKENKR